MATYSRIGMVLVAGLLLVSAAAAGDGAGERAGEGEGEARHVVCTTGMITDVVERVIGPEHADRIVVRGLIGPGVDPHLYKPTRSDVGALLRADTIFYNGLLLEGKMTDTLVRVARSGKPVYAVTERLDPEYLLEVDDAGQHDDPHVWMDPIAWRAAVDVIVEGLSALEPGMAPVFEKNAAAYRVELDALHAYAERVLAGVPERSRVLVTAHDAFNYFGRRYGFEVVGIQGLSTESEAGVRDIERLVDLLVDRNVAAVFVESTVSDRNVRALVQGAAARGHKVRIGGELFSDAMGPAGSYEGTYLGMIDHNVTIVARALGSPDVPSTGMRGALSDPAR